MDTDVSDLMKQFRSMKIDRFSHFWDLELVLLDKHIKQVQKLAVFQGSIINALTIDLQPLDDQSAGCSDFAIPAAQLAGDMAAQMMRQSIRLSHRITQLRRQNVCAGLGGYISKVTDALVDIPYHQDPTYLFGGLYSKTSKSAAKKKEADEKTRKDTACTAPQATYNHPKRGGGSESGLC
jgi:hypothetical protein